MAGIVDDPGNNEIAVSNRFFSKESGYGAFFNLFFLFFFLLFVLFFFFFWYVASLSNANLQIFTLN